MGKIRIGLAFFIVGFGIILSILIFVRASANSVSISAVVTSICGNGVVDLGEECDGSALAGQSCATRGFTGGSLSCDSDCTFNTDNCSSGGGGGPV